MNIPDIDFSTLLDKGAVFCRQMLKWLDKIKVLDFLAPLLLRLYLAPVLWMAGTKKIVNFGSTVDWFGNADWGLGLPLPGLMVLLTITVEVLGALFLLFGVGVRLITIPLMVVMVVAAVAVHWQYGWLAIAGDSGLFATDRTIAAMERLEQAKSMLQQYGDYAWLTEKGNFVVLNNGIEFAATYFIMLLVLFFMGGGRYVSADYWLDRKYRAQEV